MRRGGLLRGCQLVALRLVLSCIDTVCIVVGDMQIDLGNGRVLPLSRLRGTCRPLILAGSKGFLAKCMRDIRPYKTDLRERGISCAPPLITVCTYARHNALSFA
jgi:hypothetical protein